MQLTLFREGKEDLFLMVPTYFDEWENKWFAELTLPKSKRAICANGIETTDLQKNLDKEFANALNEEPCEITKLFKPMKYWKGLI